jgi:hypothetical protein
MLAKVLERHPVDYVPPLTQQIPQTYPFTRFFSTFHCTPQRRVQTANKNALCPLPAAPKPDKRLLQSFEPADATSTPESPL